VLLHVSHASIPPMIPASIPCVSVWRGSNRRRVVASLALALALAVRLDAAEAVRVALLGATSEPAAVQSALRAAIETTAGLQLAKLESAQGALIYRGPGALGAEAVAALREFRRAGKGAVVIAAEQAAWSAVPELWTEGIGATPGGPFAGGAPMTVINLFPHPIFAGVARFETDRAMPAFSGLPDDAQLIMEGTVGEETTPLAWVRRREGLRWCHLVPGGAAVLVDPAYRRIVGHALLWALGRTIPGAPAIVQRTFMPDSHPGAIAITFPEGPGVCLDPVRGGINYVWDGDFVDLRPRWLTKQGAPARIFGGIFYQEKQWQPLRSGMPAGEPDFHFRGYSLKDDGPEFHYLIGGRSVSETIRAGREGVGIVRSFRVGAGQGPLWLTLEPQPGAEIVLRGLERDGDRGCFPAAGAGEFTIEIRRKAGGLDR
jgi:hypothetical protein